MGPSANVSSHPSSQCSQQPIPRCGVNSSSMYDFILLGFKSEFLSYKDVTVIFGISESTIRRMNCLESKYYCEKFPVPVRVGTRSRKFRKVDVLRFISGV